MAKKISPKDNAYVEKISENLEGVAFSGPRELDEALEEIVNGKSLWSKLRMRVRRLLGLPTKTRVKSEKK